MNNKIDLPLLETERLFLVPWSSDFAEDMLSFASNPNVVLPSGGWKVIKTKAMAEKKIAKLIEWTLDKCRLEWAIFLKRTLNVNGLSAGGYVKGAIGSIGLHLNYNKTELCAGAGYLLAEEYWGKGICAEALGKIVHYAFMGLKVETFHINHKRFNERSKRVIEKCGFTYYNYSPHTRPNEPDNVMLYKLTREDYYKANNYPEILHERDVYRINYIDGKVNDYNHSITYQKQPNEYQCGQACVAMLAGVTPTAVAEIMYEEYGTADCDIEQALNYYKIPHANLRKPVLADTVLPDICILSMTIPGDLHWSLYYKGKFYDPQFGILDSYFEGCTIHYYWEIYKDISQQQRGSFYLPEYTRDENAV
ncbi:MAG: GNAT family N-acetyltransferase [Oscillospiraceae bacterium]|nr:GNAT family N-acetyltransferase [Oscillospiraceae bacterium]